VDASAGTLRPVATAAPWRDVALVLGLFVLGRLITWAAAGTWFALDPDIESAGLAELLCRWDCRWYLKIAEIGYEPVAQHWERGDGTNWAFFPLLPMLIAGTTWSTGLDTLAAGHAVALTAFFVALVAFHAYVRDLAGERTALFAAGLLALWPFSIHATVPMSEAVFLPASILVFLFARRGQWIAAGLAAVALSASRAVGMFGVFAMLVLAVQQFGWRALLTFRPDATRALLAMALAGFGLGLFMAHLWFRTGDALAFSHIQTAWARKSALPWDMLIDEFSPWFWGFNDLWRRGLRLATALAALALTAVLVRRRLVAEAVFVWVALGVAFTSGSVMSFSRFAGALFPSVLALSLLADRPRARAVVLALSAAGLVVMTLLWVAMDSYAM
jgi:hypothetical protein